MGIMCSDGELYTRQRDGILIPIVSNLELHQNTEPHRDHLLVQIMFPFKALKWHCQKSWISSIRLPFVYE